MRSCRIALALVTMATFINAPRADADIVLANNVPTGFQFTSFRGDVGYEATGFPNTADGQLFVAQASGTVESITSYINNQLPGQSVPLQVGIYTANGSLPGSLVGNLVSIAPSAIPTPIDAQVTLDMSSSHANVIAGQSYFVLLTVTTPNDGFPRYSEYWIATQSSGFPLQPIFSPNGGATWQLTGVPQADQIPLTIAGQALVPEPSSAFLFASTVTVVMLHLRLRHRASGKGKSAC